MCKCRTHTQNPSVQVWRGVFININYYVFFFFFFSYVSPRVCVSVTADFKWCKRVYLGLCFHLSQLQHLMSLLLLLLCRRRCVCCVAMSSVFFSDSAKRALFKSKIFFFFLMARGRYTRSCARILMWICWAVCSVESKSTNDVYFDEKQEYFSHDTRLDI